MRRKSTTGTFGWVVLGGLVGASFALLFAPQKGSQTRKRILKYGKKAGDRAQRFIGNIAEALDEVLEDVLQAGGEGLEKGKKLTDRARTEILDILEEGRKYIEEERGKLEKMLK